MSEFPLGYERIDPTTWVYLSSLLMLGLYFKFSRYWSVRNIDIGLLILLAPGLLMADYGHRHGRIAQQEIGKHQPAETVVKPPEEEVIPPYDPRFPDDSPPGPDSPGPDSPGPDSTGPDSPGPDSPGPDSTGPDSPGPDSTGPDSTGPDSTGPDSTGPDSQLPKLDNESNADNTEADDSAIDATESDVASIETSPIVSQWTKEFERAKRVEYAGFVWLFLVSTVLIVRLLVDVVLVRRPLLEPNLSTGGLTFLGASLFVFLMANVVVSSPEARGSSAERGPGFALFEDLPDLPTLDYGEKFAPKETTAYSTTAGVLMKIAVILSQLAVVLGIVGVAYRHFGNLQMGIGVATLYLMLPYTAHMTGRLDHVLPAAMLVWGVFFYRRPLVAGIFLGLAMGLIYYPLYLLPLWVSFYWKRGLLRFSLGVGASLVVACLALIFFSESASDYFANFRQAFGLVKPKFDGLEGVWGLGWQNAYRVPVIAAFAVLAGLFALWPAQKNLGTLLSCSAAILVASQLWHGFGGGLFMAWYLPLLLLTFFRPNLEDRVALSVLADSWFPRRRTTTIEKAA